MNVKRMDYSRIDRFEKNGNGGVKLPAFLTRAGVFTYYRDGKEIKELRHEEEVFNEDSINSLKQSTVTFLHPQSWVDTSNWKSVAVGNVTDRVEKQDNFVFADLLINDSKTIENIEQKKISEISCGYTCDIDPTPGIWQGEHYDSVQRNIRYNHVALGPDNWGRAGKQVRLRLDSNNDQTFYVQDDKEVEMKIRIDGVEYDATSDTFRQVYEKHVAKTDSRISELETENKQLVSAKNSLEGERDALKKELELVRKDASEEVVEEKVKQRLALFNKAAHVLGDDYKLDGKSNFEIMTDAIRKMDSSFSFEGKSAEYVKGFFDHLINSYRGDSKQKLGDALINKKSEDALDIEALEKKAREDYCNQWKTF